MNFNADDFKKQLKKLTKRWPGAFICMLVGPYEPGICNYISNGQRSDVIKALRETADRLENNEDNPRNELR